MKPADPGEPLVWLQRARSNLLIAQKSKRKGVMLEDLCFNAQQAAEKALKGACLAHGLGSPRTHSLVQLSDLLQAAGVAVPEIIRSAGVLTQYAVQARYPGPIEELTQEEYEEALALASNVVFWAEAFVSGK
ncbi:MAG: HEPN domain-containing protein [Chloroflexota bacterium]